ncbi:MAG: molybdopterin molybdotransferase MoeA [Bacteroidales bacterium]|nr:molybdopterin molybdotransferase MoeA [Bacteroidales bacterium]
MITFEEALEIVLSHAGLLETETVGFTESLGRVLAENIVSDMDMPPFDKSAMDGYACRKADLKNELEVLEIIAAGQLPGFEVCANQCSKIMTGAMIPKGADCVIMVEHTRVTAKGLIEFTAEKTAGNICFKGEDIKKGEKVLSKGLLIKPQHIAVLASVGCVNPTVYRKAKVGILSTGDELVEPQFEPGSGEIRNSNAWQLMAQARAMNVEATYFGIAPDEERQTLTLIKKALETCDVMLLTGGISMGDYDFVPAVLKEAGFTFHFKSLAVQPGRPTLFGSTAERKICFGLPGNPVSSFNQFELLVKPMLMKMMGHDHNPVIIKFPMAVDYRRKKSERLSFIPVLLHDNGSVSPVEYHGSAHINALNLAFGLMSVPIGVEEIKNGELADVRPL